MMAYKLQLIYIIVVCWFSLVFGRPWEDSQIKQLTEYQDISQPERPPTNKIVFSCSFNKEYNKYACTETKPHLQESPCNADDPNCLRHGIHDAKPQKNDSKSKGCNNPKIAICKGPLFPGKRNNIKDSVKRPDQQRSSCNHGDVLCLVVNRKSLRTFSRLKRKLKASQKGFGAMHVGVAKDCTSSGDPSCTRSIEPASIKKIVKRQRKLSCKEKAKEKFCRFRPQPMGFTESKTSRQNGMDWQ